MKTKTLILLACLLGSPLSQAWAAPTMAECQQRMAGKTWQQVPMTQCRNEAQRAELLSQFPADLVDYFEAQALAIAQKVDRKQISVEEGRALMKQATSAVISESQRRAALAQQQQQSNSRGTVTYCLNGPSTICF